MQLRPDYKKKLKRIQKEKTTKVKDVNKYFERLKTE